MNLPQGQYSMPVAREASLFITSPYGERVDPINKSQKQIHHGIDIRTRKDDLLATENNGKVIGVDNRTDTGGGKRLLSNTSVMTVVRPMCNICTYPKSTYKRVIR